MDLKNRIARLEAHQRAVAIELIDLFCSRLADEWMLLERTDPDFARDAAEINSKLNEAEANGPDPPAEFIAQNSDALGGATIEPEGYRRGWALESDPHLCAEWDRLIGCVLEKSTELRELHRRVRSCG